MPTYKPVENEQEIQDYYAAAQFAVDTGLVSMVSIANHLQSGIARAGRILDLLEDNEIIEVTDFDWHRTLVDQIPAAPPNHRVYDESREHMPATEHYKEAVELVKSSGFASRGQFMRRLDLRLERAAELLQLLEGRGVIAKPIGSSPRWPLIR